MSATQQMILNVNRVSSMKDIYFDLLTLENYMQTKTIWTSKKFWFNAITILVAIAAYFGFTPDQALTDQTATFLVSVSPLVNLVLTMFFTKKPVTL